MKIIIKAKNLELTGALENFINKKIIFKVTTTIIGNSLVGYHQPPQRNFPRIVRVQLGTREDDRKEGHQGDGGFGRAGKDLRRGCRQESPVHRRLQSQLFNI